MEKAVRKTPYIWSRKDYKFRQKIFNFLFFLTVAIIFWLLKILENNYTTNISLPIEYIPHKSDVQMIGEIPNMLLLNVTGKGYTLLETIIKSKKTPLRIPVLALNLREVYGKQGNYYALTHHLTENIQRQIGPGLTLHYIQPDTLWYKLSPVVRKKIKVLPDIHIKFIRQYMLEGDYIVQPESVMVSGPNSIVDTLKFLYTVKENYIGVFRSFSSVLKIKSIENVDLEVDEVTVTVPIDKFTQTNIKIPISTINVPDSVYLKIFPQVISVTYLVSFKNYSQIKPEQFIVVVDYNESKNFFSKLPVKLLQYPYMVKILNYSPKNVDYLIEKKMSKYNKNSQLVE